MTHTHPSRPRAAARTALSLFALAAVLCCGVAAAAHAQSGRKSQKPLGLPTEAPKPGEPAAAKPEAKKPEPVVSFIVMRYDMNTFGIDPVARDGVAAAFGRRLRQSAVVEVSDGGKGGRAEARALAKKQEKAYVVLFSIEEQAGQMSMGQADSRTLILRTFVYTPKAGDLKYNDIVYQRPAYDSARVGGVRIPVPTRRVERYPSQLELEQAARDAADRLLSRFQVAVPQDNE